ncbi:MAG: cytosolic protein, partial [Nitrososphaerota archaeon]
HPHFKATRFSTEDQQRLAGMGALMEHCAVAGYDPKELAEDIRRVGPGNCIISSDAGQPHKGHPVDVLLKMIAELKEQGISDSDIERMTKRNPSRLVEHLL